MRAAGPLAHVRAPITGVPAQTERASRMLVRVTGLTPLAGHSHG